MKNTISFIIGDNMNISNFRKIAIFMLAILIVCLISVGIWSYSTYNKGDPKKEYEVLDVNSDLVKELFFFTRGYSNKNLFNETTYSNLYYINERVDISEMSPTFKKLLAYYSLDTDLVIVEDNNLVFKASDLREQYTKIFGEEKNYEDSDIYCNCPFDIKFDESNNRYFIEGAVGYEILEGYENELIEAIKYEDRIERYEVAVFYLLDVDNNEKNYYANADYTDLLITMPMSGKVSINDYREQLHVFKYTFVKSGAAYTFNTVEMEK